MGVFLPAPPGPRQVISSSDWHAAGSERHVWACARPARRVRIRRVRAAVSDGSSRLGARLLRRELAVHGVDAQGVPFADLALQQRQGQPSIHGNWGVDGVALPALAFAKMRASECRPRALPLWTNTSSQRRRRPDFCIALAKASASLPSVDAPGRRPHRKCRRCSQRTRFAAKAAVKGSTRRSDAASSPGHRRLPAARSRSRSNDRNADTPEDRPIPDRYSLVLRFATISELIAEHGLRLPDVGESEPWGQRLERTGAEAASGRVLSERVGGRERRGSFLSGRAAEP